jgi:hypothetical protein
MAIKPKCDICKKELKDYGSLLFSPPNKKSIVKKYHICKGCFQKLIRTFGYGDKNNL